MEEPIIYTRNKVAISKVVCYVANDEKDEFMKLIKDPGFQQVRHYFTAKQIFERDALEIATAVFNGETKDVVIGLEDLLEPELTALHLAAKHRAPRLTHYLLQRGAKADHIALDFSTNIIATLYLYTYNRTTLTLSKVPGGSLTILDLLWRVCFHNRHRMEVTRILVQSTQNKTWARDAFMEYAMNGDLHKVVALFLAVPELFLSPPRVELSFLSNQGCHSITWKNTTFILQQAPLLADFFGSVGQRLAAYIRLEDYAVKSSRTIDEIVLSKLQIDFFLREASQKTVRPIDYYLSFFELGFEVDKLAPPTDRPECIDDDKYVQYRDWDIIIHQFVGNNVYRLLPYFLARKDFDRSKIYRLIPRLQQHDANNLRCKLKLKGV